ncbi:MAG: 2Fe-2S iron-sulfur cluster binding domain-containing protein [Hyphomicrobiales bacterium]|nr:2Fe-2S iron-sulfur cluster binding domain-containing protein [Hyphomicrobiales bacterium]
MVSVTFTYEGGRSRTIDVVEGQNLMEAAVRQGVEGIDADCGGALSCATCHVWVDPEWSARLSPRKKQEDDMLGFAVDVREASRLSCQIVVTPALDGLVVGVPPSQK